MDTILADDWASKPKTMLLHSGWVMSGATLLVDVDGAGLGRHVGAIKYRHIASGMQLVQYAGEEQARFRNAGKETIFATRDEGIAFVNALHMMGLQ